MDIQQKFLDLTDYTYVLGEEDQLLDRLPSDLIKDEAGNWYLEIGETETMFCCHLDTAAGKKSKVTHDIFQTKKGDTGIGTDGSTILGADDKAGVVLLMNLIENNVPGLYYFFIGEERGCVGSNGILKKNEEKFKKYKRCIAFDRRDYGSVITKQKGRTCCSDQFADALIAQFATANMEFKQDPFGIYTDSATFMSTIPEVTNLSVGYFHEHTVEEVINITYLEKLADASLLIKWEELPTVRIAEPEPEPVWHRQRFQKLDRNNRRNRRKSTRNTEELEDDVLSDIFYDVDEILDAALNLQCAGSVNFIPEKTFVYINEKSGDDTNVIVHLNGSISIGSKVYNSVMDLEDDLYVFYGYKRPKKNEKDPNIIGFNDDQYEIEYDKYNNATFTNYWEEEEEEEDDDDDTYSVEGKAFAKNLSIQDFLFDILNICYANGTNYVTYREMDDVLDAYNKKISGLISWIKDRDNDPDRTYGLQYDEDDEIFIIDDEDLE